MDEDAYQVPPGWVGELVRVDYTALPRRSPKLEAKHHDAIGVISEITPLGIVLEEDALDKDEPAPLLIAYGAINTIELNPDTGEHERSKSWRRDAEDFGF